MNERFLESIKALKLQAADADQELLLHILEMAEVEAERVAKFKKRDGEAA